MTALTRAAPPPPAGAPQAQPRLDRPLRAADPGHRRSWSRPFVWMVLGSFKPQAEFLGFPPTWLPEAPTTNNYQRLFDQLDFPRFFFNSIVVAVVVTSAT